MVSVSVFVPAIKLCYKCGQLGHISKTCSRPEICLNCASNHPREENKPCTERSRCVNCDQAHRAFDRSCPALIKKREISSIMAHKNIPYFEARRLLEKDSYTSYISPKANSSSSYPAQGNFQGQTQLSKKSFAVAVRESSRSSKPSSRETPSDDLSIFTRLKSSNQHLLKGLSSFALYLISCPEGDKILEQIINKFIPIPSNFKDASL